MTARIRRTSVGTARVWGRYGSARGRTLGSKVIVVDHLPKLVDALPTLAAALRDSLLREGDAELAAQVDEVRIHATCGCDEEGCLSVYVAAARGAPCGDTYRVVMPDAVVTIGVCAEQIEYIEDGVLQEADDTPDRRREYRALEGTVPTRLPTDL